MGVCQWIATFNDDPVLATVTIAWHMKSNLSSNLDQNPSKSSYEESSAPVYRDLCPTQLSLPIRSQARPRRQSCVAWTAFDLVVHNERDEARSDCPK